jgi:two-component system, cell cycle sensor histidine kinase and response regulator CckA
MGDRPTDPQQRVLARFALEHLVDGVLVLDREGAVLEANRAALSHPCDVRGLFEVNARERGPVLQLLDELRTAGKSSAEITCVARDGQGGQRVLLFTGVAIEGCSVVLVRDMTAQHALEGEVRELRALASLGLATASVVHDLNNLLTPIYALSSLLATQLGAAEQATLAQEIYAAAERAARLTRTVLTAARPSSPELETVDVNEVIAEMQPLLERLLGGEIDLVLALADANAHALIERARLEHAILNRAVNARDAMAQGGQLTITITKLAPADEPERRSYVLISVGDTGAGMTEDVRARIFDRFFTTKEAGAGIGLGLASVRNFVTDSGGFVSVHSEAGKGTAFVMYLPSVEQPPPSGPARRAHVRGGTETVLVIDADESVRRAVRLVLEAHGYRVLAAESERAARGIARSARATIALVLVDADFASIGEHSGSERLPGVAADAPFVVMSGHARDPHAESPGQATAARPSALRKAFSSDELLRVVRTVLDANRNRQREQ